LRSFGICRCIFKRGCYYSDIFKGGSERLEFFREFSSLLGIFLGERFVAVTLGARTEFYLRLYEKFDGQSKVEAHGTNVVPETRYSCI
jgi:hypothetical protein